MRHRPDGHRLRTLAVCEVGSCCQATVTPESRPSCLCSFTFR